ncbi:MAG: 30S ribosomal protein S27ae [Candidatus Verstraetearchaeota archaeon]|nr:30S ribosomal protein S27ae [Candidatus Verstraetearchaeota archaeon]
MSKSSTLYEFDYNQGTIKPKNKKCSRCGRMMARHTKPGPRWACGYCGYTEFIRA